MAKLVEFARVEQMQPEDVARLAIHLAESGERLTRDALRHVKELDH